ncbi:hypothetical protein Tco_0873957 [Tanacetum coccineum]|uniref:Uncharacterized protein n=1 Tax=Tanacetum coccineum TaxID=301880 RepID=A0ABQ5BKN0_9ASTR
MVDTLMYLTASRPDLTFVVCMCARYQAKPTKKHLHAIKRIFKYLRETVNRGLWYPKDSSIALTGYAVADHAGCQDTRRRGKAKTTSTQTSPTTQAKVLFNLNLFILDELKQRTFRVTGKKVETMPKSAWTEKDQIDNFMKEGRLMRNLEKFVVGDPLREHQSDTQVITMKMEILLESTSNKLMVEHAEFDESNTNVLERFYTLSRNPVKEILLKLNLPDHRSSPVWITKRLKERRSIKVKEFQRSFSHSDTERLSRKNEVLKLNYFKKDAALKLFKLTNQERYEHVGPKVTSSQDGKVTRRRK